MSVIAMPAGLCGAGSANASLYSIITSLGLTTNLKLCLDAGAASSYNPSIQTAKWLDMSGNGYDFYRGSSGVGDGAEPTFNGSAGGLSDAEYFSFDGGDYFSYDSTAEAWMDALHNDGAIWSIFCMYRPPAGSAGVFPHVIFSTGTQNSVSGVVFQVDASNNLVYTVVNGGVGANNSTASTGAVADTTWGVLGYGITENGGAGASSYIEKDGTGTWNSTNGSVNANVSGNASIGSFSSRVSGFLRSGSRLACLAVWQGTALTTANLSDLYDAIKGRFGL